ncbi:MAG: metallophosphoesterase [Anaerolineae bacterium]|nr:metallophosphoesterase [Anaerolineae bacterium]
MTLKKLAWTTDLHLNFLDENGIRAFLQTVIDANPDAVLIGGDITDAPRMIATLRLIEQTLQRPIYFVLGNHDYYHGSIRDVRQIVRDMADASEHLTYLSTGGVISFGDDPATATALVGHGGWGDGRLGDYAHSWVTLNDHVLIEELAWKPKADLLRRLNHLGDEAAAHIRTVLPQAFAHHRRVIVLTHVPPFKEACWHEGQISDDNFLPHFTCKAVGDALLNVMDQVMAEQSAASAKKELLVLCGHTHGAGEAYIRDTVRVLTGGADYGAPAIQHIFEVC